MIYNDVVRERNGLMSSKLNVYGNHAPSRVLLEQNTGRASGTLTQGTLTPALSRIMQMLVRDIAALSSRRERRNVAGDESRR